MGGEQSREHEFQRKLERQKIEYDRRVQELQLKAEHERQQKAQNIRLNINLNPHINEVGPNSSRSTSITQGSHPQYATATTNQAEKLSNENRFSKSNVQEQSLSNQPSHVIQPRDSDCLINLYTPQNVPKLYPNVDVDEQKDLRSTTLKPNNTLPLLSTTFNTDKTSNINVFSTSGAQQLSNLKINDKNEKTQTLQPSFGSSHPSTSNAGNNQTINKHQLPPRPGPSSIDKPIKNACNNSYVVVDSQIGVTSVSCKDLLNNNRNSVLPSAPPRQLIHENKIINQRSRSTSRQRPPKSSKQQQRNQDKNSSINTKCPTCKKNFGQTVFQCALGHSSCGECRNAGRNCDTCNNPLTDLRNFPFEAMLAEINKKPTQNAKPQKKENNADEVNIKCPTCKMNFDLQVYQCASGHSSCSECRKMNKNCGECQTPITKLRNYPFEAWLSELNVPCVNSAHGCSLRFKMGDMNSHVKECAFGITICPIGKIFGRCSWMGHIPDVATHFDDAHPEHRVRDVNKEMYLFNIHNNNIIMHFIKLGTFSFLVFVVIDQTKRNIYMAVQLMGSKKSSSKWNYEFNVYNKNEPRRKYFYHDVCYSNNFDINEMKESEKCALLPFSYSETFLNGGKVFYKFFIKKNMKYKNDN